MDAEPTTEDSSEEVMVPFCKHGRGRWELEVAQIMSAEDIVGAQVGRHRRVRRSTVPPHPPEHHSPEYPSLAHVLQRGHEQASMADSTPVTGPTGDGSRPCSLNGSSALWDGVALEVPG